MSGEPGSRGADRKAAKESRLWDCGSVRILLYTGRLGVLNVNGVRAQDAVLWVSGEEISEAVAPRGSGTSGAPSGASIGAGAGREAMVLHARAPTPAWRGWVAARVVLP